MFILIGKGLGIWLAIGIATGLWSLRRFHRRLDARHPTTEPWRFGWPDDAMYVILFVMLWPVLVLTDQWANDSVLGKEQLRDREAANRAQEVLPSGRAEKEGT